MSGENTTSREPAVGKRLALVVGVNHAPSSQLPALRSARQDAEAVAQVLEEYCHFTLLEPPLLEEHATSTGVKKAILRLAQKRKANDFLLLYFSGHGVPMDVEAGRNMVYLGTSDFSEAEVEGDEALHLSLPWLRDKLYLQTEAGKVVLLLDCCYSGEMGRSGPDPYLMELQQRIAYYFDGSGTQSSTRSGGLRQALTATGHNASAREGQAHGRMTGLLLPALRGEVPAILGRQGQLTLKRLSDYLDDQYEQMGLPLPSLSGDSAGQLCFLASFQARQTGRSAPLPVLAQADRPHNYLPFPRNPFFQPRPGEFEHLERLLFATGTQQPSVQLGLVGVTGMGGVGKTQLAVELAYRYQSRFPGGIFWMPATGHSVFDWQHTLADLAVKTNFLPPGDDPANPEYEALRARHLCRYFASHADVLVILDNVEEPRLVTTALSDLAGGTLTCTVLYTSRHRTPPTGAALYPVEALSEEGALRLLLESTRPALLAEVLADGTSTEAAAARQLCQETGFLPLALTHLQGVLAKDRHLALRDLGMTLQERGALALMHRGGQQASLEETFQLSWQQVRDERARRFFFLASLFPEATLIPLWLIGLAAGLGESTQPFGPLWEVCLSLQELSLLEGLSNDQVRLHPLVRAFGQHQLQQEGKQGRLLRAEAGSRLVDAFKDLALLEQRARRTTYRDCLEQLRAARDYTLLLYPWPADQLSRLERWLDRESYLLADERWWPETIPGFFYQQLFNRGVETGEPLPSQEAPACWIQQAEAVRAENPALLRIFAGHTDTVRSVAFSPDGRQILTGSDDGTARLWESSSGRALAILQGHTNSVRSVAFSPDERHILSGSDDETAHLWETSSGRLLTTLAGNQSGVISVAFTSDGSQILTGSSDGTARFWETSSGRHLSTVKSPHRATSVALAPSGQSILIGSPLNSAILLDVTSGRLLATFEEPDLPESMTIGDVTSVAFAPDGRQVLIGFHYSIVHLWETVSGRHLSTLGPHESWVRSVAFSSDGSQVLTGSEDRTARLWETSSGRLLAIFAGHKSEVTCVAFSSDGRQALTGSKDQTARLWEISSEHLLTTSANHQDEMRSERPFEGLLLGLKRSVAFSPNGQSILTSCLTGDLHDQTARLWETTSGRLLATFRNNRNYVASVAFSPDGRHILTGDSRYGTARLWETTSGRLLATFGNNRNPVASVAFSPDGQRILTSGDSYDKTEYYGETGYGARLWETTSGRLLATLTGHKSEVTCVAFSSDGRQVLTGSEDQTACLWETTSGRLLVTLAGHKSEVTCVAFSPDGRQVLTGSEDQTACLWETTSGRHLSTLEGHHIKVTGVAFSPNGQMVVTCDAHGWNFFWRMSEPRGEQPLGLYITALPVEAVVWQDEAHLLLATDTGETRGHPSCPSVYRLSLEGPGWWEKKSGR